MVAGVSPVILLVKVPIPVPLFVKLFAIVGLAVVPQHTPLDVTAAPPSLLILPPLVEEVVVIDVTDVVVNVAKLTLGVAVVKLT